MNSLYFFSTLSHLTDTSEFTPKWTRVFSTRAESYSSLGRVGKKREENTRVHFGAKSPVDKFRVLACMGLNFSRKVFFLFSTKILLHILETFFKSENNFSKIINKNFNSKIRISSSENYLYRIDYTYDEESFNFQNSHISSK